MKKKALILSGIYWNEPLQRHQQFATYLSRMGYEVIFVEKITSSKFSVFKFLNIMKRMIFKKAEYSQNNSDNTITEGIKPVNYGFVNPENGVFKIFNQKKIEKLLKENGHEYDLVINYLPINTTRMILDKVNYKLLIYDCVRNFSEWGEYRSDIKKEETMLIKRVDKIFTDSYYLTDKMMKYNKPVIQFLPIANNRWREGCIKKKHNKIENIAYFGSIDKYIDIVALKKLSDKGYKIHIWGVQAINLGFEYIAHGYISDLKILAEQVSTFCDAIILPYQGNMNGVIPAKMLQCMATGMPIFITYFYDSIKLKEFVYLYKDHNDLLYKVENFNMNEFVEVKLPLVEQFAAELNENKQQNLFEREIG